MSIPLKCRECGAEYQLRDELAGKRVKCKCGQRTVVPAAENRAAENRAAENPHTPTSSFLDEELAADPPSYAVASHPPSDSDARLSYPVHEYLEEASRKHSEKVAKKLEPTAFPLLVGVFEFPWHIDTLGAWIPMSMLLLVAGGMQAFLLTHGVQAGMMGVRTIGVSAFIATIIASAYAAACSMAVIEETADGNITVQNWPTALQWKEWSWGLVFMVVMWFESAFFAFIPTCGFVPWTVIPTIVLAFTLFPIVLLASSEAGALVPMSKVILTSLKTRPLLWMIFFVEYFAVLGAWCVMVLVAAVLMQWWALVVGCPLLAAVILIESRLMGRLAWCIGQSS